MKTDYKLMRKRAGFTLLELLIVVIIIAILTVLAIPQYVSFTEKARASEALAMMGSIRKAEDLYKLEKGTYTESDADLHKYVDYPAFGVAHEGDTYWIYCVNSSTTTSYTIIATRSNKGNTPYTNTTIFLDWNDATGVSWGPGNHPGQPK